jgi:chromosome partitioning protein
MVLPIVGKLQQHVAMTGFRRAPAHRLLRAQTDHSRGRRLHRPRQPLVRAAGQQVAQPSASVEGDTRGARPEYCGLRGIALLARKGGTGKTTLAVHLAIIAAESGRRVLLVDTDPQRSAGDWWRARQSDAPQLVECASRRVPEILRVAEQDGVDLVVVDTRPSVEADTAEIARLADLVLLPVRPGILDLRAIGATVDVLQAVKARAAIVLNAVPASRGFGENGLTTEARRALQGYGLPMVSVAIGNRVALAHALIDGRAVTEFEPDGKAAGELRKLFNEMETTLWPELALL